MPFEGLKVLSLESRRAVEIEKLIRNRGGDPFIAPSMREIPLTENPSAFSFASQLESGAFQMGILLTGVGTRYLSQVLDTRYPPGFLADQLRKITTVCRGPKPASVLREWNVPITILVPEPNTWRELLAAVADRPEKRVFVQEYGRTNPELIEGLQARGCDVTQVPVYQWDLPEDTGPLREGVRRLAAGEFQVIVFTTSLQVEHLLKIAEEEGVDARSAMARALVASIGPTTSATLREAGLAVDFEPSHPKMGLMLNELSDQAHKLLQLKA